MAPDTPHRHYTLGVPDIDVRLGDDPEERGDALPYVDVGGMADLMRVERRGATGYCVLDRLGRVKCWGPLRTTSGAGTRRCGATTRARWATRCRTWIWGRRTW